jgi:teichuronic acid biosynthesis glycosyltransferase TuaG
VRSYSPRVSIVCPAYNAADFLPAAVDSVLAQSVAHWDLIIVDDGSTDATAEIALRYSQEDSRIRVVELGENRGVAQARNAGIIAAEGRWIAFLDSDDYWLPNRLQRGLDFAEGANASFVYSGYRAISHDGRHLSSLVRVPKKVRHSELLRSNVVATSTVLIDRATIGDFQMVEHPSEDFICWLAILKRIPFAHGLPEDLARYRITESSLSRDKSKVLGIVWSIYRNVEGLSTPRSVLMMVQYAIRGLAKQLALTRTFRGV